MTWGRSRLLPLPRHPLLLQPAAELALRVLHAQLVETALLIVLDEVETVNEIRIDFQNKLM